MSRFRNARWAVIGVWTGAAITWGTAAVVARQPAQTEPAEGAVPEPAPIASERVAEPTIPAAPDGGLVVIRVAPSSAPEPQVVTRYVASPSAPAPAPNPTAAPPAPRSGGS